MDDEHLRLAADLFKTLGNPSRLHLLRIVQQGPATVGELGAATGLSQPLTSQHLRSLRLAGLVSANREGRRVVYELADAHVGHVLDDALIHVAEEASATTRGHS